MVMEMEAILVMMSEVVMVMVLMEVKMAMAAMVVMMAGVVMVMVAVELEMVAGGEGVEVINVLSHNLRLRRNVPFSKKVSNRPRNVLVH